MAGNLHQNEYCPDTVSAPGESLLEMLETMHMSQAELAERMSCPIEIVNGIIQQRAAIKAGIALQLEGGLHTPASFWLKCEQQYRESLARLARG